MEKEEFARQVKERERQLYRIARCYLRQDADCADAVQEAILRAWSKRQTLRDESLFGTWLTRIVINECKTLLRKQKRVTPSQLPLLSEKAAPAEQDDSVRQALFALPPAYRAPLVLQALDGYSIQEIAKILRLPTGTVKTHLFRAKKMLKNDLQEAMKNDN